MPTDATEASGQLDAPESLSSGNADLAQLGTLLAGVKTGVISALETVATGNPDLRWLGRLLAERKPARIAALRNFANDNPDLGRLKDLNGEQLAEFDFFEALDLYWKEEVHSRFLVWLLDPQQNHGADDYFLRHFLLATGTATPDEVHDIDWATTSVRREWLALVDGERGYLDILLVNHQAQILCAIENKIFSPEGFSESVSQLTHYRRALEQDFCDFSRRHVFLSPQGVPPQQQQEREFWTPANYTTIRQLVEQTDADCGDAIREDVRVFLRQYAATLRRNIVPESQEVLRLARRIYLENREAINLIHQQQPNWVAEAKQMLKEAVAGQSDWKLDREDASYVRFRSAQWDNFEVMRTGTGWLPQSGALLLFEFGFDDGVPWLGLYLSAGDDGSVREKLFEAVRQHPEVFKLGDTSLKDSWTTLHREEDYILEDADYGIGWDDGSARAKIMDWVAAFATNTFPKMNEIIVQCLRDDGTGDIVGDGRSGANRN